MPARELPARPNLDQYKKQAKELVKAAKEGNARAFALMSCVVGRPRAELFEGRCPRDYREGT